MIKRITLAVAAASLWAAPGLADDMAEAVDQSLSLCEAVVAEASIDPLGGLTETDRSSEASGALSVDFEAPGGIGRIAYRLEAIEFDGFDGDPGLSLSCWLRLSYAGDAERDAAVAAAGAWLDGTLDRGFAADDGKKVRRTILCRDGAKPVVATLQDRDWMNEVTAKIADFGPKGPQC